MLKNQFYQNIFITCPPSSMHVCYCSNQCSIYHHQQPKQSIALLLWQHIKYNKDLQHKQTKIQSFLGGGVVGTNNGAQTNKHK
jgi:hypothetical protein